MIRLSIVVPVYNVELYLNRCIESCLNQNVERESYEIIIVNDGSTDRSCEIAKEIKEKNDIITLISQDNKGLSAARNKGLSLCRGDYVWFVDSDDWIEKDCLKNLYQLMDGTQVISIGYNRVVQDKIERVVVPQKDNCHTGRDVIEAIHFTCPAQFYIYKRSFLKQHSLAFFEGVYHEDLEFTPRMLYHSESIKFLKQPIYNFVCRPNSITTSSIPKKAFDLITVSESLSLFSKNIKEKKCSRGFDYIISICINNSLYNSINFNQDETMKLRSLIIQNRSLFKHLIGSPMIKHKIEGILFSFFPKRTLGIYKFIENIKHVM